MGLGTIYLIGMNVLGYFFMYEDKRRAKGDLYRIRERTLWIVALFGGSLGTMLGMFQFRHKTKRWSFKLGFTLLAAWQVFVILFLFDVEIYNIFVVLYMEVAHLLHV